MFKFAIEMTVIVIGGFLLITQIIVPTILSGFGVDLPLFWLFKKSKPKTVVPKGGVEEIADRLKQSAAIHRTSEKEVDSAIDVLRQAKDES